MAELIRKQTGDLVTLHSPQLEMFPGLRHAYFTRHGGVSQGVYESMNFRFAGTDSRENVLENHRIAAAFWAATEIAWRARHKCIPTILWW
jgi:copper oxidase (laccase) domain-containing protein